MVVNVVLPAVLGPEAGISNCVKAGVHRRTRRTGSAGGSERHSLSWHHKWSVSYEVPAATKPGPKRHNRRANNHYPRFNVPAASKVSN